MSDPAKSLQPSEPSLINPLTITYKLPIPDPNVMPEICLPQIGQPATIVVPALYHEDWPAYDIRIAGVDQTWSMQPSDADPPYTTPAHGTFDMESLFLQLYDEGTGAVISFQIPDRPTTIKWDMVIDQYYCASKSRKDRPRRYGFTVVPRHPWSEKIEQIPYPEAPLDYEAR